MSKTKFIPLDRFFETKNARSFAYKNKKGSGLYFFPKKNGKPVWLIFKGRKVFDLKIFNLTPDKKQIFNVVNPITNKKFKIKRRFTKDQKEFFIYQISIESATYFIAYLVRWDLSHWSGFSSIQEEKAKEFSNIHEAKKWLETKSGTKTTLMAYSIVKFSGSGLDLQLPCKIGLKFS